jgi:penicillin-binding protein 2
VDPRTVAQEDAAASDTAAQTAPDAANDAQTDTTAAEPQQATALAGVIEEENNDALLAQ